MAKAQLDHIEIHVADIDGYCEFLVNLFGGGRYKQISDSGTSMYITETGDNFEIKKRVTADAPARTGLCLPCIRMENATAHLAELDIRIDETIANPEGTVHFFTDHEGIQWHVKNYAHRDRYINW